MRDAPRRRGNDASCSRSSLEAVEHFLRDLIMNSPEIRHPSVLAMWLHIAPIYRGSLACELRKGPKGQGLLAKQR